jgi:hypothetical protein
MSEKWRWYREPIIVVPVLGIGLGLGIVPFAVWGQAGAPAFYGSLTAALIAAGAVVGNSRLQSIEYDRQQAVLARRSANEAAIQVLGYATYAVMQLHLVRGVAKAAQFAGAPSPISPMDKSTTTIGQFRSMRADGETAAAQAIIQICSKIPPEISSRAVQFLYFFITTTELLVRMPSASANDKVVRQTLQSLIENCDRLIVMGVNAIRLIEDFLIADGIKIVKYVLPANK